MGIRLVGVPPGSGPAAGAALASRKLPAARQPRAHPPRITNCATSPPPPTHAIEVPVLTRATSPAPFPTLHASYLTTCLHLALAFPTRQLGKTRVWRAANAACCTCCLMLAGCQDPHFRKRALSPVRSDLRRATDQPSESTRESSRGALRDRPRSHVRRIALVIAEPHGLGWRAMSSMAICWPSLVLLLQ